MSMMYTSSVRAAPPACMHTSGRGVLIALNGPDHGGVTERRLAALSSESSRRLHVLRLALHSSYSDLYQASGSATADLSSSASQCSGMGRRQLLAASAAVAVLLLPAPAFAEPDVGFVEFRRPSEGYRIERPAGWEETGKAGADILFLDPERKSTTVGVTVSPVRIASLEQFGDVTTVGKRLLDAERAKESTKSVEMVSEGSRSTSGGGVTVYDFLYELDSTRGRKQILSTVAVVNKKLYIVNGNYKCETGGCDDAAAEVVGLMQRMARSFDVLPTL